VAKAGRVAENQRTQPRRRLQGWRRARPAVVTALDAETPRGSPRHAQTIRASDMCGVEITDGKGAAIGRRWTRKSFPRATGAVREYRGWREFRLCSEFATISDFWLNHAVSSGVFSWHGVEQGPAANVLICRPFMRLLSVCSHQVEQREGRRERIYGLEVPRARWSERMLRACVSFAAEAHSQRARLPLVASSEH
jgi:hypothetical protein